MSRRKRFELNTTHNSTFTLNITSMTDMFTLLLVFLLQNFAATPVEVEPIQGLALPISNSYKNPIASIQLTVSQTEIRINDKLVAKVQDREIASADVDPQDTNFILPLFKELQNVAQDTNIKKEEKKPNYATSRPEPALPNSSQGHVHGQYGGVPTG